MSNDAYFYILTNSEQTSLYLGVTEDLLKRVYNLKNKIASGLGKERDLSKLVYYERFSDLSQAILREKQLKSATRQKKIDLINKSNPGWDDLYRKLTV